MIFEQQPSLFGGQRVQAFVQEENLFDTAQTGELSLPLIRRLCGEFLGRFLLEGLP
jgi:hypothetical protein